MRLTAARRPQGPQHNARRRRYSDHPDAAADGRATRGVAGRGAAVGPSMRKTATSARRKGGNGLAPNASGTGSLRKGAVVNVYRLDPRTGPYMEARGVIQGACRRPHFFYVRFFGERVSRVRFVHPDWRQDPERCLTLLRSFWEASREPPAIDEFFPTPTHRGGVP